MSVSELSFNCRVTDIQASIGLAPLSRLESDLAPACQAGQDELRSLRALSWVRL